MTGDERKMLGLCMLSRFRDLKTIRGTMGFYFKELSFGTFDLSEFSILQRFAEGGAVRSVIYFLFCNHGPVVWPRFSHSIRGMGGWNKCLR